jgi:hypothetical protein
MLGQETGGVALAGRELVLFVLEELKFFGGPALVVNVLAFFGEVAAAQAGELAGQLEEGGELGGVVGRAGGELLKGAAQGDGERGGEDGGEGVVLAGDLLEAGGFLADGAEPGAGLLVAEPVGIAALFPVAEVGFVDGAAAEVGGEDGLDFGEGVEPGDEGRGRLAVVEAGVELVTEGLREAGDFAGAGHGDPRVAGKRRGIKKYFWEGEGGE